MSLIEKVLLLQDLPIFSRTQTHHLLLLASVCRAVEKTPGDALFQEGEKCTKLFLLLQGRMQLNGSIAEKTILGLRPLISRSTYPSGATALDACTLLEVDYHDLARLVSGEPDLCWSLLEFMAAEES